MAGRGWGVAATRGTFLREIAMTASQQPTADQQPTRIDALVIGAGFGGMYAVHKLSSMGLSVQGFEAGGDVGGVWYWNRYPGARCDLMSLDYCYSFSPEIEQEWTWSEQFAAQTEILAYANFVADRLDLRRHFSFKTWVTGAVYDEAANAWRVTVDDGRVFEATYCVMASGPLSIPKGVPFDGAENFKGEILLAAKWPHTPVSFEGKRVGLVGTGSTGIQIVPEVAKTAGSLTVFQRTPSFTLPMRNVTLEPDYVAELKRNYAGIRQVARNSPLGGVRPQSTRPFFSVTPEQRRALMEDSWARGGLAFLGTFSDLLINPEANEQVAEFVRSKISEVVTDQVTAEKLKPRGYPIFARRPCLDTNYYETFNLPHVTLHDCLESPIVKITPVGLLTETGEVELDVLIFATGYDGLTGALLNFDVVGRGGLQLRDKWRDGAKSHLGLMVASFPNLFLVCGPNGPAALANIITLDQQNIDWVADAITHMRQEDLKTIEPTEAAEEAWMNTVFGLAELTLVSKANTWYVGGNITGKPRGLSMYTGGFQRYAEACRLAAENGYKDFVFEKAAAKPAAKSPALVG
jgi:cation diffusion facilitator CzcD-associated flavoprotein CzcO